ncbi:hypothetical protein GCM10010965_16510 [Caldalkalibacillus thermarum]|nr:hypothetical protein GCM10010965_16510 [Caldalkalibacillus thermarum]
MTRQHITQPKPLLIRRAGQLVTLKGSSERPLIKEQMRDLGIVENGSVWIEDGKIIMADTDEAVLNRFGARLSEATVIEANGRLVTPGLVDPHTHLVFVGSREDEFERRLNGATYMEIMAAGGGIHRTTRATQAAGEEELYRESYKRLDQFLTYLRQKSPTSKRSESGR